MQHDNVPLAEVQQFAACGQARTALYSAIPSARVRFTEPPSPSRPDGDDRWRKGGSDAPLKMSGIF
jgi:hypothetical protein